MIDGLVMFLVAFGGDLLLLVVDLCLWWTGELTISRHVWHGNWMLGVSILAWQLIGMLGLTWHFFGRGKFWGPSQKESIDDDN